MKTSIFLKFGSLIIIFLCFSWTCNSQVIVYKNIPKKYFKYLNKRDFAYVYLKDNIYDLTNILPKNFVKSGQVNYTKYIQSGLDSFSVVSFPDFPILVDSLNLRDNSILIFKKNSSLILKPNSLARYNVINIKNRENIRILNATIIGDRVGHMGKIGEWGFGVNIVNSNDIIIDNLIVSNCWGDGIYINCSNGSSNNILISNCFIDNNRRNGISIISGKNIRIKNCIISNTNGTQPMCGIDFEPNNNFEYLNDIYLDSVITFNNKVGMAVNLGVLSKRFNRFKLNINFNDCIDEKSLYAMGFSLNNTNASLTSLLNGEINIKNCTWIDNVKYDPVWMRNKQPAKGIKLNFLNSRVLRKGVKFKYIFKNNR